MPNAEILQLTLVNDSDLREESKPFKNELTRAARTFSIDLENPNYNEAFLFYIFFEEETIIKQSKMSLMAADRKFYNKYYRLLRFAKLYQAIHGRDAGIEQQIHQILEHAECEIDWLVIKEIDASVGLQC